MMFLRFGNMLGSLFYRESPRFTTLKKQLGRPRTWNTVARPWYQRRK